MTGQDLTTCVVCRQPLAFVPRLGELIAHDECAAYVKLATTNAYQAGLDAGRLTCQHGEPHHTCTMCARRRRFEKP